MSPHPEDGLGLMMNQVAEQLDAIRDELRQIRETNVISNKTPAPTDLLTIDDLAEMLRVSTRTLRTWRHEGELPPAITIGGALRWRRTDVDAWLAKKGQR